MNEWGIFWTILAAVLILFGIYVFYLAIRSRFRHLGYAFGGPVFILGGIGSLVFSNELIFLVAFLLGMLLNLFLRRKEEEPLS